MKPVSLLSLFAFLFITAPCQNYARMGISKNDTIPEGLQTGKVAPDFSGVNQYGDSLTLYNTLRLSPVVLIFYRGYWCPSCNEYLAEYQDSLRLIRQKGASLIAVTPEQADGVAKTTGRTGATFDIISDHDNSIMQKYKVDFKVTATYQALTRVFTGSRISENNGQEEAYLPVPATFLIGRDGRIIHTWFDPDYRNRPGVSEILRYLE